MKEQLKNIIATLNNIELKGAENMARLLACIQALEQMTEGIDAYCNEQQ